MIHPEGMAENTSKYFLKNFYQMTRRDFSSTECPYKFEFIKKLKESLPTLD